MGARFSQFSAESQRHGRPFPKIYETQQPSVSSGKRPCHTNASPKQAKKSRVKPETVQPWIRAGKIAAFNVASS